MGILFAILGSLVAILGFINLASTDVYAAEVAAQNAIEGVVILFSGFILFFLARIRKIVHPMSILERIEAVIGLLVAFIGVISGIAIINRYNITIGLTTSIESIVILVIVLVTYFRKSGISQR